MCSDQRQCLDPTCDVRRPGCPWPNRRGIAADRPAGAEAVQAYIEKRFDTSRVKIKDFPLFPCGRLVQIYGGDSVIVFFDFPTGQVRSVLPDKCGW